MFKLKRKAIYPDDTCAAARCRRKTGLAKYGSQKGDIPLCETHAEESGLELALGHGTLVEVLDTNEPVEPIILDTPVVDPGERMTDTRVALVEEAADAEAALQSINEMTVADADDAEFAAEMLADCKGRYKALESRRKKATQPMNEALKEIRGWFKPATDFYQECERTIKDKLASYHEEQARNRQQALVEAQQAAKYGTAAAVEASICKLSDAEEPEIKGLTYRTVFRFEVVDADKLPVAFLMPNEKAIGIYVSQHGAESSVPGVRVWSETIVASRSN